MNISLLIAGHRSNEGNGLMRNFDIRTRVLSLPLLLINIIMINPDKIIHFAFTLLIILILFLLSGRFISKTVGRILILYPMILFLTLPLLLSSSNSNQMTSQGPTLFFLVQIKYILTIITLYALSAGVSFPQVIQILQYFRLPPWMLVILQYIAHLIRVLGAEYRRIKNAYICRAASGKLMLKIKTVFGMMYVLTIRSIERSERIFHSMISRGFTGTLHIQPLPTWRRFDAVIVIGLFFFTLFSIISGRPL